MAIEPDGTIRLCYRIGGRGLRNIKIFDLPKREQRITDLFESDRKLVCKGCVWNCIMMSEFLLKDTDYCRKVFRHNQ